MENLGTPLLNNNNNGSINNPGSTPFRHLANAGATTRLFIIRILTTKTYYWISFIAMLCNLILLFSLELVDRLRDSHSENVVYCHVCFVLFSGIEMVAWFYSLRLTSCRSSKVFALDVIFYIVLSIVTALLYEEVIPTNTGQQQQQQQHHLIKRGRTVEFAAYLLVALRLALKPALEATIGVTAKAYRLGIYHNPSNLVCIDNILQAIRRANLRPLASNALEEIVHKLEWRGDGFLDRAGYLAFLDHTTTIVNGKLPVHSANILTTLSGRRPSMVVEMSDAQHIAKPADDPDDEALERLMNELNKESKKRVVPVGDARSSSSSEASEAAARGSVTVLEATMFLIKNMIVPFPSFATFTLVVYTLKAACSNVQSFLLKFIVTAALENDSSSFLQWILVYGGIQLLYIPLAALATYTQAHLSERCDVRLRGLLSNKVMKMGSSFYHARSEGELNAVFAADMPTISNVMFSAISGPTDASLSLIVGTFLVFATDARAGVLFLGVLPLIVSSGPREQASKAASAWTKDTGTLVGEYQNILETQQCTRAHDSFTFIKTRFRVHLDKYGKSYQSNCFWAGLNYQAASVFAKSFNAICLIGFAILLYDDTDQTFDVASFTTLTSLVAGCTDPVGSKLNQYIVNIIRAGGAVRHVVDILEDNRDESTDTGKPRERTGDHIPEPKTEIAMNELCFKYNPAAEKLSVDHVSCKFPMGSYIVLCGGSGSGKSTVLNLLLQFRRAIKGSFTFDGLDVFKYGTVKSFKSHLGVVFQKTMLINGTVRENITYGLTNITEMEIQTAAKKAEVHEVITTLLPDGYDTIIGKGEGAVGLSGGQAQRICLARALARKPKLLLLDEATSALDPKTEASIVRTLEKLSVQADNNEEKCTIISVSHHPATARNASHILVLDKGRLVEVGTWNELMKLQNGNFKKLVDAQREG